MIAGRSNMKLRQFILLSILFISIKFCQNQGTEPEAETFTQETDLGPTFLLEAEIAKRIKQGERSDLSPVEREVVLKGLTGAAVLERRKTLLNELIGGRLPGNVNPLRSTPSSLDDLATILQLERTKTISGESLNDLLTSLYGLDSLPSRVDDLETILKLERAKSVSGDSINNLLTSLYGLDTLPLQRTNLLRRILLNRRLRRPANPLNRRLALQNPYVVRNLGLL